MCKGAAWIASYLEEIFHEPKVSNCKTSNRKFRLLFLLLQNCYSTLKYWCIWIFVYCNYDLRNGTFSSIPSLHDFVLSHDLQQIKFLYRSHMTVMHCIAYRSRSLIGACANISTGRKYAPISEMHSISNDNPRIGSALHLSYT